MLSRPTLVFVYEILFLHMITVIKNTQKKLEKETPFRIDERNIVDAFPMIYAGYSLLQGIRAASNNVCHSTGC